MSLAGRYVVARWLFLRLLALTHLCAFGSLWSQAHGLVGASGIAPAAEFMAQVRAHFERTGEAAWAKVPTLAWFGAGDTALHVLCGAGVALGALLLAGFAPVHALVGLWALYLSLVTVGGVFLGYQWDALLLETTLLAVFVAPWGLRPRMNSAPTALAMWLPRLLLFKLMFSSGVVKVNHPGEWRDLTALDFHYWTQPLPVATAWYVHQMPAWFHRLATSASVTIEVVAPFLIFSNPRRWRMLVFVAATALAVWLAGGWPGVGTTAVLVLVAALLDERVVGRWLPESQRAHDASRFGAFVFLTGLLVTMGATGSYGFFHLLSFALCVTLLDDALLKRWAPAEVRRESPIPAAVFALLWTPLSLLRMTTLAPPHEEVAAIRTSVFRAIGPFASVNGYGLFARMTTDRAEVIVEGSADGETWRPYVFEYKPVAPDQMPAPALFHMPRLDWQLWFAGLARDCRRAPWFAGFARRLLENEPAVLGLLAGNPFPDAPPKQVRARLQRYTFTTPDERAASGHWWKVTEAPPFCPALSLEDLR
jgi:hypothetical protein